MSWQAAIDLIKAERAREERMAKRIATLKTLTPWVVGAATLILWGLIWAGIVKPLYNLEFSNYAGSGYYDPYYDYIDWRGR